MTRSENNPWLHRFSVLTAMATLGLIGIGGLVTSHGVGMAVPDWPTTYGYNMFFFPFSYWVGGIFYEHTHRLFASFVGLLTTILAVWLWLKESRRWLRRLGVLAFFAVVVQGVLGGLRVTMYKDEIGIFHGTLAQIFLVLVSLIALFTSRDWQKMAEVPRVVVSKGLRRTLVLAGALIFVQLALGATMRHQHAGLAVPDFPLAYGQLWPVTDPTFLATTNQRRVDVRDFNAITAFQIHLHMVHRLGAILALIAVLFFAGRARHELGAKAGMTRMGLVWSGLLLVQAALGAATVLSNKAADIATAHVVVGSLCLVWGGVLCVTVFRLTTRAAISAKIVSPELHRAPAKSRPAPHPA